MSGGAVRRLRRIATSVRTSAVLLVLLAALLLINSLVPQRHVVGDEEMARLAVSSRAARFFLIDLGFGHVVTSPLFLVVTVLFFAHLLAVLAKRAGATWRRTQPKHRSPAGLRAWAETGEGLEAPVPDGFALAAAIDVLRGYGYRARKLADGVVWGVKHRTAPLGFLLFHLSFFLLCAGAIGIWATRFVGTVTLGEGQTFNGTLDEYARIRRLPPLAVPPTVVFTLDSVEPRFDRGEPLHLAASLRFAEGRGQEVEVNHPAHWGTASVLVQRAGLAPLFWLQDARGFTVDRVVVAATSRGEEPTEIPLAEERLLLTVEPLAPDASFPERSALAETRLRLRLVEGDVTLFEGELAPGQAADLGAEGRLVLEEIRYWAGLLVVAERGGALLIAGFVLGVLGLVWRLLAYRREIALVWDARHLRLVGRSEYFARRFEEELATVFDTLLNDSLPEGRSAR